MKYELGKRDPSAQGQANLRDRAQKVRQMPAQVYRAAGLSQDREVLLAHLPAQVQAHAAIRYVVSPLFGAVSGALEERPLLRPEMHAEGSMDKAGCS